jgi:hypothetical protein
VDGELAAAIGLVRGLLEAERPARELPGLSAAVVHEGETVRFELGDAVPARAIRAVAAVWRRVDEPGAGSPAI